MMLQEVLILTKFAKRMCPKQLFLVSFSSFFRDAESFEVLGQYLFEIMDKKNEGESINIWVPGCASGEEVYTLAITLAEIQIKLEKK